MSWATFAIKKLQDGKTVTIKPTGNSMKGKIESGQEVTVEPIKVEDLQVGDVVLCKVKGRQYLHLIKTIDGERFLIGNNRGKTNGWTRAIYGKAIL